MEKKCLSRNLRHLPQLLVWTFLMLSFLSGQTARAQEDLMQWFEATASQAKTYTQQKQYEKSNECCEQIIARITSTPIEGLIPTVKNTMAINNLYLAVDAMKEKDFTRAKPLLDKAVVDAKKDTKTYYMACTWMGDWYSTQSLNIRLSNGNLQQALEMTTEAERWFNMAQKPEKRLSELLSKAKILDDLKRKDEARTLLQQVIAECGNRSERDIIRGKALYQLGSMEADEEDFQQSIAHLEQSYNLCSAAEVTDYAKLAARRLTRLYKYNIPDTDKESFWQQRSGNTEE